MKLQIIRKVPGSRILWTNGRASCLATGMRIDEVNEDFQPAGKRVWLGGAFERAISCFRLSRQLLRFGIHHLWPLPDGGFLIVVRKRAYRVCADGRAEVVLRFPRGNKPAHKGVCVTPNGYAFLGEYAMNMERKLPVVLYRSRDGCKSFQSIYEFSPGEVRHIHFVQWDSISRCLWMGTGDADNESWIFRSTNYGDSWEKVGGGSQLWRAVGVSFRAEAIYWGTDAGSDAGTHPNYAMRWYRASRELKKVCEIQGPCHGNAVLRDGTLLVSTGVEGGVNEKDRCAHLWASRNGTDWHELIQFEKDRFPLILQYGVMRFPQGLEYCNRVAFTCLGLVGEGETIMEADLVE